jgi:hypothetical protein
VHRKRHAALPFGSALSVAPVGVDPYAGGAAQPEVIAQHWCKVERLRPTIISLGNLASLVALLEIPTNGVDLSSIRLCVTRGALLARAATRSRIVTTECAGLVALQSLTQSVQ